MLKPTVGAGAGGVGTGAGFDSSGHLAPLSDPGGASGRTEVLAGVVDGA